MKIVIICNGLSASFNDNGPFIDSCDIVIRLNRFVIEGFERYIGSKITIISLMLTGYGATSGIVGYKPLEEYVKRTQSIWIPDKFRAEQHESRVRAMLQYRLPYDYPFKFVRDDIYDKLMMKMQDISTQLNDTHEYYFPDSGMTTIEKVIYFYPSAEIYITGFDPAKRYPSKYYWQKDEVDAVCVNYHPQKAQAVLYEKYIKSGKIREI
jgi:hypothetical protein